MYHLRPGGGRDILGLGTMKQIFASLLSAACLLSVPQFVSAQAGPALAEARGRVACGAGTLVSATYIGGGLLRVTCSQPNSQTQQNFPTESPLVGTGLTAPVVAGTVATVLVISVITGSNNTGTTTTTTTTTAPVNQGGGGER